VFQFRQRLDRIKWLHRYNLHLSEYNVLIVLVKRIDFGIWNKITRIDRTDFEILEGLQKVLGLVVT